MRTKSLLIISLSAFFLITLTECGQKNKTSGEKQTPASETTEPEASESVIAEPEGNSKSNPLGVKSAIIEYSYYGNKTGKSTHYLDDYGRKTAMYTEFVEEGGSSKGWSVTLGDDQYMWDLSKPGEGMKMKNPMIKMIADASLQGMEAYMASMYEQMGMTQSGTEKFQGKECTVFKGDMGKVLIWKGIMMKMEMNIGTVVSRQEVTSIKTNVAVDGKYFRIPDNVTFNDIPGF